MATKRKFNPALLYALAPIAVTAITLLITAYRWQGMAGGLGAVVSYWFLRSAPLPNLLFARSQG